MRLPYFTQIGLYFCCTLFCSSRVQNNVSVCDRNPYPDVLIANPAEVRNKQVRFDKKSKSCCPWVPIRLLRGVPTSTISPQLLQTSTSVQMMEFATAATSYFFLFPPYFFPTLDAPPPFLSTPFFFSKERPTGCLLINKCLGYVFWSEGQKGLACDP